MNPIARITLFIIGALLMAAFATMIKQHEYKIQDPYDMTVLLLGLVSSLYLHKEGKEESE